jgi:hypothetical protein
MGSILLIDFFVVLYPLLVPWLTQELFDASLFFLSDFKEVVTQGNLDKKKDFLIKKENMETSI